MSYYFKLCVALSDGILYEFDVVDRSVRFGCGHFVGSNCNSFLGCCISLYNYCICIAPVV